MWYQTEISERLGVRYPILLAPMAELVTPQLSSVVSNSGGIGALGMWGFSLDEGAERITQFHSLCEGDGALNLNYPLWNTPETLTGVSSPMQEKLQSLYTQHHLGALPTLSASSCQIDSDHLNLVLQAKPSLVSFHFGLPGNDVLDELKNADICLISSATTVAEAQELNRRGVDFIIAQGLEAGGHRGTFSEHDINMQSGLFSLLPQIVDAVDVPVIAAGGIADGRGIAAAMMLGASGVQIGTAFLRCPEANVDVGYQAGLRAAVEGETILTKNISGRNARFIKNKLVDQLSDPSLDPFPFPAQYKLTLALGDSGNSDMMDLIAGQSVAMTREMSAEKLMDTLVQETTHCLS